MELADFLYNCPPFEQLARDERNRVAEDMTLVRFGRGEHILYQGGEPSQYLYILHQGEIGLGVDGQVSHILETHDSFGYPSVLGESAPIFDVTAVSDVVAYRLPADEFRQLFDHVAFARFFIGSLGERLRDALAVSGGGDALATPVKYLIKRDPLFIPKSATVQHAATVMSDAHTSSVLVETEPLGIVTDRDLRRGVLATGLGPATPISRVMSQPVISLDSDMSVFAALLRMMDEQINHLALVEEGKVVGVISSTDLLRHQTRNPLYLRKTLKNLDDIEDMSGYAEEIMAAVDSLDRGGLAASQIGQIISSLNDTLVGRLAQLAEEKLGPPPVPYAWIVFGSEGRLEQMLLTDQDNALIYAADPNADATEVTTYFAALAQQVVDGLITAGFPPCPGGYMATNWCKSLDEWLTIFSGWIHRPEPKALMEASIFFDFRAVYGELSLEPLENLITSAAERGIFLPHLVRAAQEFSPPLGFFNRIRASDGRVDLKHGGIAPIVGLARACSLAAGSRERSTLERLIAAADGGSMSKEGAENLAEMFQFLLTLRLRQQLADIRTGKEPSNRVRLNALSMIEKRHLKEAFVIIRQMQDGIGATFRTGTLG